MKNMLLVLMLALSACGSKTDTVTIQGQPGPTGPQGPQGPAGANGHSLVSVYQAASYCECGSQGGSRLDIYMDSDDSLSISEGDLYENSIVVCNGANGLNGANGQDGAPGANGQDGAPGLPGTNGQDGAPGAQGPQGPQGEIGPQGLAGVDGLPGAVGPQGIQGLPGPTGPVGPQGPQGLQGPAGSSGATISAYPSTGSCVSIVGSSYYTKSGDIYDNNTCSSSHKVASLQGSGESFWVGTNMLAVDNSNSGIRVITFN